MLSDLVMFSDGGHRTAGSGVIQDCVQGQEPHSGVEGLGTIAQGQKGRDGYGRAGVRFHPNHCRHY